jgi:hypothetical protein
LCDAVRNGQQKPRGTVPPTPVWPTRRTLERGRRSPLREDGRLLHARTGLRRDVGPTGPVTIGPMRPSPTPSRALHHHLLHYGRTGRQDAATPAAVRPTASRQLHPRANVRTTTTRATLTPPPSKPLLDGHRARHDAPPDARFVGTTVYSVALYAMPPRVDKTVRHACKLPPPWPIKGGVVPQPQGGEGHRSLARFSPLPRYWHLTQSVPLEPGGPASSPTPLVAPSTSTTVQRNIVPRAHPCWTYGPQPEPG